MIKMRIKRIATSRIIDLGKIFRLRRINNKTKKIKKIKKNNIKNRIQKKLEIIQEKIIFYLSQNWAGVQKKDL